MNLKAFSLALVILNGMVSVVHGAEQLLLVVESGEAFAEATSTVQQAIRERGYTVSRVQKIDYGLRMNGYERDHYQVVFFGKAEEIAALVDSNPETMPYLPLRIALYVSDGKTYAATLDPSTYTELFPEHPVPEIVRHWAEDIRAILHSIRETIH